jgi:hypothetical protein
VISINDIVIKVFGINGSLPFVPAGPALIYLIRRFGYTGWGGDPDKEVCNYYLPTGEIDVFVAVSVTAKNAWFGVGLTDKLGNKLAECWRDKASIPGLITEEWLVDKMGAALVEEERIVTLVEDACEAALRDLLRPVFVRSTPINILGEIADPLMLGKWDEEQGRYDIEADPHWTAGMGMELEAYRDHDMFLNLLEVMASMGSGNLQEGMRVALKKLRGEQ